MPQRAATIASLAEAFAMVKAMQADGLEWGEGYRPLGRQALVAIIEGRTAEAVDTWIERLGPEDLPDRRNGHDRRQLLTALGDIELCVPRTRRFSPAAVLHAYARREAEIDRVILAGFVLGLSTRKVGEALLALLGQKISASTVSRVAKTLDAAVAAFHRRPLEDVDKVLMLDGVVLSRKTGAGALKRPVLVALGIRPDGKKEVIDFHLAASESAAEWERFLTDLYRRGLHGESLDMICGDGGQGLLAALPIVFEGDPPPALLGAQDQECLEQGAQGRPCRGQARPAQDHECRECAGRPRRRAALRRPLERRLPERRRLPQERSRRAVDLLPLHVRSPAQGGQDHQRHRAPLPRSAAPYPTHGTFQDKSSMNRILFAVFTRENTSQGVSTPFLLTQNN